MKKLIVSSFALTVMLAATATAQESSTNSEQSKSDSPSTVSREVLKKTTHGRTMLDRNGKDPEEGRFMRALVACVRYYTGENF